MDKVYVPSEPHEKAMLRALIQYRNPKNYYLVHEALIKAHREDLIGSGPKCLIRAIPPRSGGKTPPPKLPPKLPAKSRAGKVSAKPAARKPAPAKKGPAKQSRGKR